MTIIIYDEYFYNHSVKGKQRKTEGPQILQCDVRPILETMNMNKAIGPDEIIRETISVLDHFGIDKF